MSDRAAGLVMPDPYRTAQRSVTVVERSTGLGRAEAAIVVSAIAWIAAADAAEYDQGSSGWIAQIASAAADIAIRREAGG